MELNELTAVSPIDGRYRSKTSSLSNYFSEFALIRYRVWVEIEYFIALCESPLPQLKDFDKSLYPSIRKIYQEFTNEDAVKVKDFERVTNHDVKSVEYFIKEKFDQLGIKEQKEFVHFGLTSQDVNNTAIPLSLKNANVEVVLPMLEEIVGMIDALAAEWADFPILALTHGQPASPSRLGKEFKVFSYRATKQLDALKQIPYSAKFGGATGNFNAHHVAYPEIKWVDFGNDFVNNVLGLDRSQFTTQIENYDNLAALFDAFKRVNTILIDMSRDIWQYVSMRYFKQKINKNEVGSSAMPHKVNPIDFENAEGNLGIANALLEHLSAKLPISRLQRDLTDSTVLRNIGVPLGHILIALQSLKKGLNKLELNDAQLKADLEDNWAVVAEAIQTVLRREGIPNPYEMLKDLTRKNEKITESSIQVFIEGLAVSDEIKAELKVITPYNYTGL
ncbi:adenylosuccinate lyase [Flammeovirga kamogawensis]|uniref:Adenylosuccinate lyase n=1 Tax=Flammeovirga kamogawensis TaxID=373891 RepID=A0ABX8GW53_9BACT|nr:adenylosuccinate lyase [Flammeovirga kamogawensis]MBB6461272.1 adenylosuccinate lyase [Flammeovirga kamogawensis]QWG07831.1 adenylosuccinate lyase [Flammeovirga kamogawensis]TRX69636.1 adenylosuccinate lyase [Flammeovirga kamogawensis]